jgi:hypothetical protein
LIQLGSLTKGAIVERGDGELGISPELQPVLELTGPTNVVTPTGTTLGTVAAPYDQSFVASTRNGIVGVGAVAVNDMVILARGMWVLEITAVMMMNLAAAVAAAWSGLYLLDPDANITGLIEFGHVSVGLVEVATSRELHLTLQRDAFVLRFSRAATGNAADAVSLAVGINGRRVV